MMSFFHPLIAFINMELTGKSKNQENNKKTSDITLFQFPCQSFLVCLLYTTLALSRFVAAVCLQATSILTFTLPMLICSFCLLLYTVSDAYSSLAVLCKESTKDPELIAKYDTLQCFLILPRITKMYKSCTKSQCGVNFFNLFQKCASEFPNKTSLLFIMLCPCNE